MNGLGTLGMMALICGPSLGLLLSIIYRDYREKADRLARSARRKSATVSVAPGTKRRTL